MPKLLNLIENGISIIKENAVTALSSLAEASKTNFDQYYDFCMNSLSRFFGIFNEHYYKQFKGRLVEAITIISCSVSIEKFRPHYQTIIDSLLDVQNNYFSKNDT